MSTRKSSRLGAKRPLNSNTSESARAIKKPKRHETSAQHQSSHSLTARSDESATFQAATSTSQTSKDNAEEAGNHQKPFRLLDLPAEIRIEIYRACLTRPFNILLSKPPQVTPTNDAKGEAEVDSWLSDRSSSSNHNFVQNILPAAAAQPRGQGNRRHQRSSYVPLARRGNNTGRTSQTRARAVPQTQAPRQASIEVVEKQPPRPEHLDPLLVGLLRTSKLVYKEARPVLYGENSFILDIRTALASLAALHQRSRGQIRFLQLTIPSHSEILGRFAEIVRLSLRYCWRLQTFTINMPFLLPGADGNGPAGNTIVYANAFDILRWLPRQCQVVLEGNVSNDIRTVVDRNANLAKNLDELAYARRQLISNETGTGAMSFRMAPPRRARNI